MKKTSDEMNQLIVALEQVFDIVRLINPTQLAPCIENALMGDESHKQEYCFQAFQKDIRCSNCISLDTFTKHKDATKIEFIDRDPYFVIAKYVEVDDYPYVLELAHKIRKMPVCGHADLIGDMLDNENEKYTNYETGLFNRRYYHDQVKDLPASAVAFVSIDDLPKINKQFGYAAGNEAIVFVSQVIKLRLRHGDVAIRNGSHTFMVVFRNLEEYHFVERLRDIQNIVHAYSNDDFPNLHMTVSIGGTYEEVDHAKELVDIADGALQKAKLSKNSIVIQ
jgi:putative two-component system response regulator